MGEGDVERQLAAQVGPSTTGLWAAGNGHP